MPRNVRNFWIQLNVDGSKSSVETGPRSADGGFTLTILQRHKGDIQRSLRITGRALSDGTLILDAEHTGQPGSQIIIRTER